MRGIYSITNIVTGTVYFGQTKQMNRRFTKHKSYLNHGTHQNSYLQHSWNKYGKSAFVFKPIEIIEDVTIDLTPIEKKYYDSTTNKYNLADPEDPLKVTSEIRKKRSEKMKGNKYAFGKNLGNKNALLGTGTKGLKMSDETKKKISLAKKGNICSEEAKKNISIAVKQWWKNRKRK